MNLLLLLVLTADPDFSAFQGRVLAVENKVSDLEKRVSELEMSAFPKSTKSRKCDKECVVCECGDCDCNCDTTYTYMHTVGTKDHFRKCTKSGCEIHISTANYNDGAGRIDQEGYVITSPVLLKNGKILGKFRKSIVVEMPAIQFKDETCPTGKCPKSFR